MISALPAIAATCEAPRQVPRRLQQWVPHHLPRAYGPTGQAGRPDHSSVQRGSQGLQRRGEPRRSALLLSSPLPARLGGDRHPPFLPPAGPAVRAVPQGNAARRARDSAARAVGGGGGTCSAAQLCWCCAQLPLMHAVLPASCHRSRRACANASSSSCAPAGPAPSAPRLPAPSDVAGGSKQLGGSLAV